MMELLPKGQQVLIGTIMQLNSSFVGVVGCLYFWLMSKDWTWLMIAACISGIVSMIGVYIMPESPKFLITKRKYEEARVAINWIARFNARDEIFDKKFDREVLDLKAAAKRRDWAL
jgi:hypothetical protein